jgi:phosphoribosylformylglycinamidine synthase
MPVLGICNGFQILCESHLLPGALSPQRPPHVRLPRPAAAGRQRDHAWTSAYETGDEIGGAAEER